MALPVIGFTLAGLVTALSGLLMEWGFKFLVAMGVSFVSYEFTSEVLDRLMRHIETNYFRFDPIIIDIFGLAGVGEAFNIIFGAFNFCVGLFTTGKALKFFHGVKK